MGAGTRMKCDPFAVKGACSIVMRRTHHLITRARRYPKEVYVLVPHTNLTQKGARDNALPEDEVSPLSPSDSRCLTQLTNWGLFFLDPLNSLEFLHSDRVPL